MKAKTLEKKDDKAKVELTIDTIDASSIDMDKIAEETQAGAAKGAELDTLMDAFMKNFAKAIEGLQPKGTKTIQVECTYDSSKGVWLPNDMVGTSDKILETAGGDLMK